MPKKSFLGMQTKVKVHLPLDNKDRPVEGSVGTSGPKT